MRVVLKVSVQKPAGEPGRVHPKALAYSRFHCDDCGNPVDPDRWVSLAYEYNGREHAFLACPACLQTKVLLPPGERDDLN